MVVDRTANAQIRHGLSELLAIFIVTRILFFTPFETFDEIRATLFIELYLFEEFNSNLICKLTKPKFSTASNIVMLFSFNTLSTNRTSSGWMVLHCLSVNALNINKASFTSSLVDLSGIRLELCLNIQINVMHYKKNNQNRRMLKEVMYFTLHVIHKFNGLIINYGVGATNRHGRKRHLKRWRWRYSGH